MTANRAAVPKSLWPLVSLCTRACGAVKYLLFHLEEFQQLVFFFFFFPLPRYLLKTSKQKPNPAERILFLGCLQMTPISSLAPWMF